MNRLRPIEMPTLTDEVVYRIESLILGGSVRPGQKLPPERELAAQLGVSRPVVHAAIIRLEQKGLVRIEPRHGCYVNDYRTSGSAELLTSLWTHKGEELEPAIIESMLEFRVAVEQEAAGGAAVRVAQDPSAEPTSCEKELRQILADADRCDRDDARCLAEHDYRFHFAIALHSGNLVYPMLMNTFRSIYLTLLERFFSDPSVIDHVNELREDLVAAIARGDGSAARSLMRTLSQVSSYE